MTRTDPDAPPLNEQSGHPTYWSIVQHLAKNGIPAPKRARRPADWGAVAAVCPEPGGPVVLAGPRNCPLPKGIEN